MFTFHAGEVNTLTYRHSLLLPLGVGNGIKPLFYGDKSIPTHIVLMHTKYVYSKKQFRICLEVLKIHCNKCAQTNLDQSHNKPCLNNLNPQKNPNVSFPLLIVRFCATFTCQKTIQTRKH